MNFKAFLILLLLAQSAFAKTWYVAKTGSDTNDGSLAHPYLTIQKGADAAQPGDTIFVKKGVYRERVSPPRGGTKGHPILYMAAAGAHVIIKAPMFGVQNSRDMPIMFFTQCRMNLCLTMIATSTIKTRSRLNYHPRHTEEMAGLNFSGNTLTAIPI